MKHRTKNIVSAHCKLSLFIIEISKELTKITKVKGCEELKPWIRPCENHFLWSATSTFSGNGKLIWAKFQSFLYHIINKHEGFGDDLFDKCAHDSIEGRTYLDKGRQMSMISSGKFTILFI